jgi:hypothetical protein
MSFADQTKQLIKALDVATGSVQAVGNNSDVYLNILPLLTGKSVLATLNGKFVNEKGQTTTCSISKPTILFVDNFGAAENPCDTTNWKVTRTGEDFEVVQLTRQDITEPLRVLHSRGIRFF